MRCKPRAVARALQPHPAVVPPKWRVVFLSFCLPLSSFLKRDFRLKKRTNCPSGWSDALHRPRCQGRAVCVHGSGADGLDRTSGRRGAAFRREGQLKKVLAMVLCVYSMLKELFDCSLLACGAARLRRGWSGKMGLAINVAKEIAVKREHDGSSGEGNQLRQVRSDDGFEPLLDVAEAARLLRMHPRTLRTK